MRLKGIQNILEQAGKYGCYFLCLVHIAESLGRQVDAVSAIYALQKLGHLGNDFTVNNAGRILTFLTGQNWTHRKDAAAYEAKSGEIVIDEWYNERTGHNHFACRDCFDPLSDSVTVREGSVRSTRVLVRAA
jgi:hypothetical protein